MSARVRGFALAAAALLSAGTARAQVTLEAAGAVQQMSYRFRDSTGSAQQGGQMLGGLVAVRFNRVRIAASGTMGKLVDADKNFAQRDLRATRLAVGLQAADWIEVGLEAQARREQVADETTLQRLFGPYGRAVVDFGGNGLQGLAELALYPASSSSNTPPLQLALRAGIGARYQQLTGPLTIQLMYRFNRLDYRETNGLAPLTQDEAVSLELGLRKR